MVSLNEQKKERILTLLKTYLAAAPTFDFDDETPKQRDDQWDEMREYSIRTELMPLLDSWIQDGTNLRLFKSKIDSINKSGNLWGFKGIKGQMFFNMLYNICDDHDQLNIELKRAIIVPRDESSAKNQIRAFGEYVELLNERWTASGNSRRGAAKIGSIPFFLSYFWQIQDSKSWPIYYTNDVKWMSDLDLWQPTGELGEDYIAFRDLYKQLSNLFNEAAGENFDFYGVEHTLWFANLTRPYTPPKDVRNISVSSKNQQFPAIPDPVEVIAIADDYVPPIISSLPGMALNQPAFVEAAKRAGSSLEWIFERYVNAGLTMLGFETKLLGQGSGRMPDGVAEAADENYAVIWDAKIRANGYSMGTDDRVIREYIVTQSRELKRKKAYRNIYYIIVSSSFIDDLMIPSVQSRWTPTSTR